MGWPITLYQVKDMDNQQWVRKRSNQASGSPRRIAPPPPYSVHDSHSDEGYNKSLDRMEASADRLEKNCSKLLEKLRLDADDDELEDPHFRSHRDSRDVYSSRHDAGRHESRHEPSRHESRHEPSRHESRQPPVGRESHRASHHESRGGPSRHESHHSYHDSPSRRDSHASHHSHPHPPSRHDSIASHHSHHPHAPPNPSKLRDQLPPLSIHSSQPPSQQPSHHPSHQQPSHQSPPQLTTRQRSMRHTPGLPSNAELRALSQAPQVGLRDVLSKRGAPPARNEQGVSTRRESYAPSRHEGSRHVTFRDEGGRHGSGRDESKREQGHDYVEVRREESRFPDRFSGSTGSSRRGVR